MSFHDMSQGAAFWYVVLEFFIWGVENVLFELPGLETTVDEHGLSNLMKVKTKATEMLAKCVAALPTDRLPENHFYQDRDADDGEEAEGDVNDSADE